MAYEGVKKKRKGKITANLGSKSATYKSTKFLTVFLNLSERILKIVLPEFNFSFVSGLWYLF